MPKPVFINLSATDLQAITHFSIQAGVCLGFVDQAILLVEGVK